MIQICRSIKPFYAITLDLDNTLYDNKPIICRAEDKLVFFLRRYHPALYNVRKSDFYFSKKMVKSLDPEIYHDVNSWRWKSLENILLKSGLSKHDAQLGADCAMEMIIYWRNQIDVSINTIQALKALSSKWPLIAITNGNSNLIMCGLRRYFSDVLRAGIHGRAKPYKDMYLLSSKYFGMSCKYILHVGDDLYSDIQGAILSGMQSCWMQRYSLSSIIVNTKLLPHLVISDLTSLAYFL
ncbi:putative HAD-superfamily hydrolase [Candidatus Blochmanniella vafra str. BVAF]|uniref:HAD-superfamily hydrolase n=1 Tax=Blochmanniella vafra (strain BVAF) TaxID=859654 RepID=E8Q6I9_BLOVB|nr:5-amino-6-(5-phospho-D-ribitylamino)uracil phosphatase YigB [Candidatus Blochmannia vafer]ADV33958.1 putative HAD-superfamily hydrolase [Candidatus Blochmannia vafer str. BVAF]